MNEDVFNVSIRKFLKTLGVSAQREIEKAVRQALAEGKLTGNERLQAMAVVTLVPPCVPAVNNEHDRPVRFAAEGEGSLSDSTRNFFIEIATTHGVPTGSCADPAKRSASNGQRGRPD